MCRTRTARWWMVLLLAVVGLGAAGRTVPLIEAVKEANIAAVRALVQQRVDVNAPAVDGSTALHWAVNRDDRSTVDLLIGAGANVRVANRYGVTPLSLAAENGNEVIIERLLKAGADPNAVSSGGETVLMTAARTGRVEAVKVLLAHGANVNAREDTHAQTALMWATINNNVAAMLALIANGADIHARSIGGPVESKSDNSSNGGGGSGRYGTRGAERAEGPAGSFTAFLFAVRTGRIEPVRILLEAGANVNDGAIVLPQGGPMSALMLAVSNANYELAAFLLEKGADPNAAGPGWTTLHTLALGRSQPYKTRGSISWTAGPEIKGNMSGLELAKKLMAHGANANARSTRTPTVQYSFASYGASFIGATPFLMAAKVNDFQLMRVLVAGGADPNVVTDGGQTAMMIAAGIGNKNGTDSGYDEEALEAVKVCVELGSDVNVTDSRGWTALHAAVVRGSSPLVQYLIDKGAKLDAKTHPGSFLMDPGVTPRGLAAGARLGGLFFRRVEIVALLGRAMSAQGLPVDDAEDQAGMERSASPQGASVSPEGTTNNR